MRREGISPRLISSYRVYLDILSIWAASSGVRGGRSEMANRLLAHISKYSHLTGLLIEIATPKSILIQLCPIMPVSIALLT